MPELRVYDYESFYRKGCVTMDKNNIDNLLQLLADYRSFCQQPNDSILNAHTYTCELSEEELEIVAAAAHVPQQPKIKSENP